jgi:hypothetical protein
MKRTAIVGLAALVASMLTSGAWAQSSETATGTGAAKAKPGPAAASGTADKTAAGDNGISPLINGPETNFRAARNAFAKGDRSATAQDIRKGAAFIRIEANRPNATNQADLLTSAAELESLAGNVDQGNVSSPYDLSRAFARADLALARHYHMLAEESLREHNVKQSSAWLGAATDYVNDSVAWNARQLKESGSPVVKKMRELQKNLQAKIASGAHSASQETAKGLNALGADLQQLAQKISQ